LKERFLNLYNQVGYKDASVVDCNHGELWSWQLRGRLDDRAQAEKEELLMLLEDVHLRPTIDVPEWTRNSAHQFSVNSAYLFLSDSPHIQGTLRKLWEIRAPIRVHAFLWLLLQDKILTTKNMRRRG
jgi:zinc-binding in reverse transcriptase